MVMVVVANGNGDSGYSMDTPHMTRFK